MIRATGLWKRETKDGKTYLGGAMGPVQVAIFPVEGDAGNGPDYVLYLGDKVQNGDAQDEKPNKAQRSFDF